MDCEELYKWVEEHPITRPKRNINRDFSDAIPLVEILKHHFPKLVDVHNYSPRNAYAQKLINWQTLYNKVLKKLKIHLSHDMIEQLAKSETGVIEKLLFDIKKKIEERSAGDESSQILYVEPTNACNSTEGSVIVTNIANKKTISMASINKMQKELEEKNEAIDILKNKIEHLESLLNIKEERIKDLTQQLQSIVNESSKLEASPSTRFFKIF